MQRREFITLVGGTAAAWPLAARAQRPDGTRRIGVLMNFTADEPEGRARATAFAQSLQKLGWIEGGNVRTEIIWVGEDAKRYRQSAEELVAMAPDVILASASPSAAALLQVTRSVPIVFANVIDPVGAGFVNSLARPGGNATGFVSFEYSIAGKWVELLKEIEPGISRVVVVRDPAGPAGIGQFAAIQSSAASSGVDLSVIDPREAGEIEHAVSAFAREPNGAMIVTASPSTVVHRELIISLAIRHRLPNIYPYRYYPQSGGLASYGSDPIDSFMRSAAYVDRILKGEKPSNLPVQAPTKYALVINLKTAKALELDIPTRLLATADEVIE
jgi:putative ABC transport system substrate-binding protein